MTMRMLIDARHREETRVAVVNGNRIEEFDFESAERKQLKGNIYLAKVIRVEPSLQAAFVDYGGNRHGFLAFSEIHPDYYQIPKEDREALLREEAEHAAEEAALRGEEDADEEHGDIVPDDFDARDDFGARDGEASGDDEANGDDGANGGDEERGETADGTSKQPRGGDDHVETLRQRRMNLRRRYKIQDVIRRRQVLLVQVVKEERGNKGAALTTYLSLAGRYCVLMPNTSHGGGISRKISNAADRKRLKTIMAELTLPPTMGCIVRTAGLQRTKTEIKRDFDYLARLWDGIRENTLSSAAPALIYGDSDLIKRAIRDIYNKDIDEVIVEGDEGYRQAKEFMKLLMPSHARRVQHYADVVPLFQRFRVEDQLAAMYHPVVQLKSGGYLVINPTEALVSIDINSGRSTREHNIEQTATATNLEAADEIARQLRLRDMAGLVVIDFIDMDNGSNVRKVEKAVKEALKNDRARIQVGRISGFGLMEMSRQRLRTGVLEASTRQCPHCEGTGLVRTASSAGLSALRLIEDEAARGRGSQLTLRASQEAAVYVLNRKRADIAEIEDRYGVSVEVLLDGALEGARMSVEAAGPPPAHAPRIEAQIIDEDEPELDEDELVEDEEEEEAARTEPRAGRAAEDDGDNRRRRRRRRGRRGRSRTEGEAERTDEEGELPAEGEDADAADEATPGVAGELPAEGARDGRRRRGRRGRRGSARPDQAGDAVETAAGESEAGADAEPVDAVAAEPAEIGADAGDSGPIIATHANPDVPVGDQAPAPKRARRRPAAAPAADAEAGETAGEPAAAAEVVAEAAAEVEEKPRRTRRRTPAATATEEAGAEPAAPAPAQRRRSRAAPTTGAGAAPAAADRDEPAAIIPEIEVAAPELPLAATTDVDGLDAAAGELVTTPAPANDADVTAADADEQAAPRRGWWQRTFGN